MKLGQRTDHAGPAATERQLKYIVALCRRLHMPEQMMSDWLDATYGRTLGELSVDQASEAIDTLAKWEDIPPDIRRASGQMELF